MYNPLAPISAQLIKALIKSPKIFVREYYPRGLPEEKMNNVVPLLLTMYDKENDVEQSRAYFHYKQLGNAPYAKLYDSEKNEDLHKLFIAATQPHGYKIFINMLPAKWIPPQWLRKKIHAYMLQNLPWWNYSKTNQLHTQLKDRYGKLYIQLSWKANKAEVILEAIENVDVCAMT